MIDKKKLSDMITETRVITLTRIQYLAKIADILDGIEYEIAMERGDDYLKSYIEHQFAHASWILDTEDEYSKSHIELLKKLRDIDD